MTIFEQWLIEYNDKMKKTKSLSIIIFCKQIQVQLFSHVIKA